MNAVITPVEPAVRAPARRLASYQALERVAAAELPYAEFLRRYVHRNRPVVVTGAVTDWQALGRWTPQFFKQRFADRPVAVSYDASMPFAEFIDAVLASSEERPGPYMFRLFLHEHLPELLPDLIPQNVYAFPRRYASPLMRERWRRPDGYLKLLIGGVGSRFPVMHFDADNAHATITEIHGDKEFLMYAPEDTAFLYVNPRVPNKSLVDDPHRQDLQRFPLLAKATQYRTVLKPGDMVFVPSRWWHAARALTPSVSVCSNLLDGSNWQGFAKELSQAAAQHKRAKGWLLKAYLSGLGLLLGGMEAVQEHTPRLAKALAWPARWAPASAAVAPEPSANPLHIRIPTE